MHMRDMENFDEEDPIRSEERYVTTERRRSPPDIDLPFIRGLIQLTSINAPELAGLSWPLLASVAIGAHRADLVPKMLEGALETVEPVDRPRMFEQFRATAMIVWPFVGILSCTPALLGMVPVVKSAPGLEEVARGRRMPDFSPEVHGRIGRDLMDRPYAGIQDEEAREMLTTYYEDFCQLTGAVAFGYSLAGTTARGLFREEQTQLILAAALVGSNAARQATSHLKAAMNLGCNREVVITTYSVAKQFLAWNGEQCFELDVSAI